MPTPARVVVLPKDAGPLQVQEVSLPDPGPFQVVVKQFSSGVCHSQLHQMHRPRNAPVVLGHESTGVVLARGKEVRHVKEGDRVMVTWVPRDGENTSRPPEMASIGLTDGSSARAGVFTWADHTIADEQYVVAMPGDVRTDVTAIIGCAVMTGAGAVYHTAAVQKGESVAVFGVGGVGLSALTAAAVIGADPIIAVDLDEAKLAFAKKFGATIGVNASECDPVARIRELTPRGEERDMLGNPVAGVDYAFDCIGLRVTMEQILPAVRPGVLGRSTGGTAVLVGVPQTPVELDARDLLVNEKKYIGSIGGSCRPDRDFPMFIRWYKEGDLDLEALVTARYTIDQINEATDALQSGKISGRAILEF
ncbi:MAG: zinc-binding dehydrogenase [Dehalococcoidia bacterium]